MNPKKLASEGEKVKSGSKALEACAPMVTPVLVHSRVLHAILSSLDIIIVVLQPASFLRICFGL